MKLKLFQNELKKNPYNGNEYEYEKDKLNKNLTLGLSYP